MLHNYPESFNRINTNDSMYFSIIYDIFKKHLNAACELNFLDYDKTDSFEKQLIKDYYIMIVFSAMTMEALINDYLAVCLTDDLFYENYDKLNVLQKVSMIYTLLWEENIDKSGEFYNKLLILLKKRNLFVHSKSRNIDESLLKYSSETLSKIDENELERQLLKSSGNTIIGILQESFSAIQTIFLFCKNIDNHDKNRKAVAFTMSCIAEKEVLFYNQKLEKISKTMNKINNTIKQLKRRVGKLYKQSI